MKKFKSIFLLLLFIVFFQFILINHSFADENTELDILSPTCVLMEASSGKVLFEKNAYEINYPASTTKIMTAILALEKCQLSDLASVSHDAIFTVPASYSHASLKEGEQFTIEQLLNVLLIPSANDAANVIAEHISGSVSEFANLMNEKATEIGCKNTHFVNPNGIHNKEHTTTAYDLALMGRYAMKNTTFRDIVKKTRYSLPATEKYQKTNRVFNTTNDLLKENHSTSKSNYYYQNATGIKTGYTDEAGSCIVASAKKDDMEVVVVILGGGTTKTGLSQRFLDCITLFNYAFENYSFETLKEKDTVLQQVSVSGATEDTKKLDVLVKNNIQVLLKKEQSSQELKPNIEINKLKAPISAGSTIGKISYTINGEEYSSELIAKNSVTASGFLPVLLRILLIFVTLYLLYLLLKPKKKNRKRGKKKKSNYKPTNKSGKRAKGGNYRLTQINNW